MPHPKDPTNLQPRLHSGGQIVVDELVQAGVTYAFCVPGESFLGVLDALYEEPKIRLITTRHEGAAAFMAVSVARLTGKPSVCMGTRMVGGGNLMIGVHMAAQDSAPVLALIGQVSSAFRNKEAFQEAGLVEVFTSLTKWAGEPTSVEQLAPAVQNALRAATNGRNGPAMVALREELLRQNTLYSTHVAAESYRPEPDEARCLEILHLLRDAQRPVLLLGGGVLAARATEDIVAWAQAEELPVICTWRRPDAFPNEHRSYLGQTGLGSAPSVRARLQEADVIVTVGTRLNEIATYGYTLPAPGTRLVHVNISPTPARPQETSGPADINCRADARLFAQKMVKLARNRPLDEAQWKARKERNENDHARWEKETTPSEVGRHPRFVDQQVVAHHLRTLLPQDAIVTVDAGNFSGWVVRYLRSYVPHSFLGSSAGAMGYALPAAIAAKLVYPQRKVVALCGDGGFLMTGTELETAVREKTPLVVIVFDNQRYNTIRMHQQKEYPSRPIATTLGPVDFAAMAKALGAKGRTVRTDAEFPGALTWALSKKGPTLIHVIIDPDQLTVTEHDIRQS